MRFPLDQIRCRVRRLIAFCKTQHAYQRVPGSSIRQDTSEETTPSNPGSQSNTAQASSQVIPGLRSGTLTLPEALTDHILSAIAVCQPSELALTCPTNVTEPESCASSNPLTLQQHLHTEAEASSSSPNMNSGLRQDAAISYQQQPVSLDCDVVTLRYHISVQEEVIAQLKGTGGMSRQALKRQIVELTAANQELFALWKSENEVALAGMVGLRRMKDTFALVGDFVRALDDT